MDTKIPTNYTIIQIPPPTYLEPFCGSEETINLILSTEEPLREEDEDELPLPTIKSPNTSDSSMSLIGNPLELDLKGDDDLIKVTTESAPNNYTEDEEQHFAMDLQPARLLMNMNSRSEMTSENKTVLSKWSNYAVCNGNNKKKIVGLGVNNRQKKTVHVYVLGVFNRLSDELQIDNMIQKHKKNAKHRIVNSELVRAVYFIKGWDLRKSRNVPKYPHAAYLTITWNKAGYDPICASKSDIKLNLQVMVGHEASQFNTYWNYLQYLNTLINKLSEVIEVVDDYPSDLSDSFEKIREIIKNNDIKISYKDKGEKQIRQLMREEQLLDKLWVQLMGCENLSSIRQCLIFFLEEVVDNVYAKIQVPEMYQSSLATILLGILNGTLAVPSLSTGQALKLFIEVGIDKLKLDYLHVIGLYNQQLAKNIVEQWSNLVETVSVQSIRKRMTVCKSSISTDTSLVKKHFNYLTKLHLIVEFLEVADSCALSPANFARIMNSVFDNFELTKKDYTFKSLKDGKLCELCFDLMIIDYEYLERCQVASWTLALTSKKRAMCTETIFHHSNKPIFPPTIYDQYCETSLGTKEPAFYVTEAVTSTCLY